MNRQKVTLAYPDFIGAISLLLALRCLCAAAYRAAAAPGGLFSCDFGVYFAAARRLVSGNSLYIPEHGKLLMQHVSSPLIPVVIEPLLRFPQQQATCLWAAFNTALLAVAVLLFCHGMGLRLLRQALLVVLALLIGFRFWPTTVELGIGNTDIIFLAALAGMLAGARARRWMLVALCIAVAGLTKTWTIGALYYLIARRKWTAAAASLGFFAAGLVILFSVTGWREAGGWVEMTRNYASQPMLVSNSVAGIARMYFSENIVLTPLVKSALLRDLVLVLGYGALVGGLGYLFWRGPKMTETQWQLGLAMVPLALILGCTVSHQFYFILTLPALWVLILGAGHAMWTRICAFGIYLAMSGPYPGLNPVQPAYTHGLKSLANGVSFVCGMILWLICLWALHRSFHAPAETGEHAGAGEIEEPAREAELPPVGAY